MTVTDKILHEALDDAQQQAAVCSRFCRLASRVNPQTFEVFHNGVGASDSDHQVIYSEAALEMYPGQLVDLFTAWIQGLHKSKRVNLNTGVAS